MLRYLAIIALIPFAYGVRVNTCASGVLPHEVRIAGCTAPPCNLVRGQDAILEVDFTAYDEITSLKPQVVATALGITLPFPLPADRTDACLQLVGSQCPLSRSEDVTYRLEMPVLAIYPLVSLVIEIGLIDQNNEKVSCFQVDAVVVL